MWKRIVQRTKKQDEPVRLNGTDLTVEYNPEPVTPIYPTKYKEDLNTATVKAKKIVSCADLLREKYELDIRIRGMQGCEEEDIPERESLQRKSDAMFREIRRIVHQWKSPSSQTKWTEEEWDYIQEICSEIDRYSLR